MRCISREPAGGCLARSPARGQSAGRTQLRGELGVATLPAVAVDGTSRPDEIVSHQPGVLVLQHVTVIQE